MHWKAHALYCVGQCLIVSPTSTMRVCLESIAMIESVSNFIRSCDVSHLEVLGVRCRSEVVLGTLVEMWWDLGKRGTLPGYLTGLSETDTYFSAIRCYSSECWICISCVHPCRLDRKRLPMPNSHPNARDCHSSIRHRHWEKLAFRLCFGVRSNCI